MANPIIQNYLNDQTIDIEKRKAVIGALKAGQGEDQVSSMLSKKYGDRYGTQQDILKSKVASGMIQNAKGVSIKEAVPTIESNQSPFDKVTNDLFENPLVKKAKDEYNANNPDNQVEHTNLVKDIKDIGVAGYEGVKTGLETAGKGAYDIRTALFPDTAETNDRGEIINPVTGKPETKALPSTPIQKIGAVLEGGKDIIKGGYEGVFAVPGAIANKVPGLNKIPEAINYVSDSAADKTIEVAGIDPNSEQAAKIREGMNLLSQTLLLKYGDKIGKTAGEIGKVGLSTAADLGKGTLDILGKAGEKVKNLPGEVVGGIKGKFSPEMTISEQLMKAGTSEQAANLLEKLTPEQKIIANQYIEAGIKKMQNPVNTPGVFEYAGKEIENSLNNAKAQQATIGKKLGAVKEAMAETPVNDFSPLQKTLQDKIKKLNIKQTSEGLNFSDSTIAQEPSAVRMIEKINDKLQENRQGAGIPAKDLEALTAQIESATKELVNKGKQSPGNRTLSNLKTAINESLNLTNPEFAKLNQEYAKISQYIKKVENATKVNLGNGEIAQNGAQLLRRSLGNADAKYIKAIEAMEALEREFGIKTPTDLRTKAHLANFAEKFTQSTQPQSLTGGVSQGIKEGLQNEVMAAGKKGIVKTIPWVGEPIAAIADALKVPKKNIEIAAAKIQEILSKAEEKTPKSAKSAKSPKITKKTSSGVTLKPSDFEFLKSFMATIMPYSGFSGDQK